MDPLIVVFGLGVGILIGLTGIGGGSLMTPLLLLVIGTQPIVAVGTDIAYGALTKTVGGWQHLRSGTVDLGVSTWLAFGVRAGRDRRRDPGRVAAVAAGHRAAVGRRARARLHRAGHARPRAVRPATSTSASATRVPLTRAHKAPPSASASCSASSSA